MGDVDVEKLGPADLLRAQKTAHLCGRVVHAGLFDDLGEDGVALDDVGVGADELLRRLQIAARDVVDAFAAADVVDVDGDAGLIKRRDELHSIQKRSPADDQRAQQNQPPFMQIGHEELDEVDLHGIVVLWYCFFHSFGSFPCRVRSPFLWAELSVSENAAFRRFCPRMGRTADIFSFVLKRYHIFCKISIAGVVRISHFL